MNVSELQQSIKKFGLDGWLLYDFRAMNVLALRILGIPEDKGLSRRLACFVPAQGPAKVLVHKIEAGALDHVVAQGGEKREYLRWEEFRDGVQWLIGDSKKIAMEYSPMNDNPYLSRVDAGTIELVKSFGVDIQSSGDLVQYFEARWTPEQWDSHLAASELNQKAFDIAWDFMKSEIRENGSVGEYRVQQEIMNFFEKNGLTTYHPPIVGCGPNGGDPHYEPLEGQDSQIKAGDFVLLDIWCKFDKPGAVYSDLTKVGVLANEPSERHKEIFQIVADARDAGIQCVKDAFSQDRPLKGWEVDAAVRKVIDDAGYGEYYIHRTGHNIGQETHGNGAHIDSLETKEDRSIMPETCFSIEPGIYLPEFGVRLEIDVYIDQNKNVHVTGGIQNEIDCHPV